MIATAFVSVGFAGVIYPTPILAARVYSGAFVTILCEIQRQAAWAIAKFDSRNCLFPSLLLPTSLRHADAFSTTAYLC